MCWNIISTFGGVQCPTLTPYYDGVVMEVKEEVKTPKEPVQTPKVFSLEIENIAKDKKITHIKLNIKQWQLYNYNYIKSKN